MVLVGTAGAWLVSRGLAEETHTVQAKDSEVTKNDNIDYNDEEPVFPESVETVGETITIVSKTFTPPGTMTFTEFPGTGTHVDIETDPGSLSPTRNKDTASQIKISVAEVPETAGAWPLKGEGNLQPPPGGQGTAAFHWSAKMAKVEVESTEWLVTHDPEFEYYYCQSPDAWGHPEWAGRFKQAELMANEAIVKVKKIAATQYQVKLLCNGEEVVALDDYEEHDGYAVFYFETDQDGDGRADTNSYGDIFVEGTRLGQGITAPGVEYTFEIIVDSVIVCSDREVTIKPLLDRLDPTHDPWKPAELFSEGFSPYTRPDYNDHRWEDTPVREMDAEDGAGGNHHWYFNYAYGMAIVCEFTDELDNLAVKASGGDISGERTYAVADAATYLQAGTDRTIEWEGFDDDSERVNEVADLSDLEEPLGPSKIVAEEDDYTLKIEAVRKKDTSQKQRIELRDLKVDYGLEHVFEGVQE